MHLTNHWTRHVPPGARVPKAQRCAVRPPQGTTGGKAGAFWPGTGHISGPLAPARPVPWRLAAGVTAAPCGGPIRGLRAGILGGF